MTEPYVAFDLTHSQDYRRAGQEKGSDEGQNKGKELL